MLPQVKNEAYMSKCENCHESDVVNDSQLCTDCETLKFLKNMACAGAFGLCCLFLLLSIIVLFMIKGT